MSSRETDISLIGKYLKGELDAQAMHQLEKRAQNDDFLMDALEGYEKKGHDQQGQLDELAHRLQQRTAGQQKQIIIPWKIIAFAASVLIVFSIGGFWLYNKQLTVPQISKTIEPHFKKSPVAPVPITEKRNLTAVLKPVHRLKQTVRLTVPAEESIITSNPVQNLSASSVIEDKTADITPQDSTPINEMVVMEFNAQKKKTALALQKNVDTASFKRRDTIAEQLVQGQVKGVADNNVNAPRPIPGAIPIVTTPQTLSEIRIVHRDYASAKKVIKGQVIANEDGSPMPGVTVKVAGTNIRTQTDANGRFNLSVDSNKTLVIGYIGYQTREINANNRDSTKTIALKPSSKLLGEVVVTHALSERTADETAATNAHPQNGWTSFRKYLKENALSPDGKTGVVRLSFEVNKSGAISNFHILSGLSGATNQKAIDLIVNGPLWYGNTRGITEKVKVKISFIK